MHQIVRPSLARFPLILLVGVVVGLAPALAAQETTPRPLTLEDYGDWSRITQVVLSDDGLWMAYAHQPNEMGNGQSGVRLRIPVREASFMDCDLEEGPAVRSAEGSQ